jgi:hypothetical protein
MLSSLEENYYLWMLTNVFQHGLTRVRIIVGNLYLVFLIHIIIVLYLLYENLKNIWVHDNCAHHTLWISRFIHIYIRAVLSFRTPKYLQNTFWSAGMSWMSKTFIDIVNSRMKDTNVLKFLIWKVQNKEKPITRKTLQ